MALREIGDDMHASDGDERRSQIGEIPPESLVGPTQASPKTGVEELTQGEEPDSGDDEDLERIHTRAGAGRGRRR